MHATFVTLWLQVMQPLANVHETKWTPHVKRETDVAQSYTSSAATVSDVSDVPRVIEAPVEKWHRRENASLTTIGGEILLG